MPPNLRKSQPNLSKPSEGGSFNAGKKSSESTSPLSGLNLRGERELGSVGGIKAKVGITVGVDNLIGKQGIDIEIDATNRTAGFGAGIGSTKGKLGVNIGGKVGYDENGKISIKGAEAGINIGGTGASASIDEDEGIRGSVSVAGAKVEVGIAPDGKKTLSLCYGVPGGEVCVTFEPEPGTELPLPPGTPTPTPTPGGGTGGGGGGGSGEGIDWETPPTFPVGRPGVSCAVIFIGQSRYIYIDKVFDPGSMYTETATGLGSYNAKTGVATVTGTYTTVDSNGVATSYTNTVEGGLSWKQSDSGIDFVSSGPASGYSGDESKIYARLAGAYLNETWENDYGIFRRIAFVTVIGGDCGSVPMSEAPNLGSPGSSSNKPRLPNYPQHFKPDMNCCDKVEEIYKYLGIAKLKKNKFPVSRAFLVPGGTGNDDCIDYYSIMQALFRMLANGLIINPKSRPHGSEWQSVNATGWASDMYAMMAESMSDRNSSQRFEVAAIMQLVQIMATVAENGRKIECAIDAIGLEPLPVSEEIPVCFTIYEGHKGFGDKKPKKINVSKLKTDNDVEGALGKMLAPSLIPITAWKFKPGQISISEALRNG
jgi:hypothetical protein